MQILQLSDLHITAGGGKAFRRAESLTDLRHAIDYILSAGIVPELAVITGDVSSDGSLDSYRLAKEQLSRLPCPYALVPGNHDEKPEMAEIFGDACYTALTGDPGCRIDLPGGRLLLLDSALPGAHSGGVSEESLRWLQAQLPEDPGTPVLVFLHHFPFRSGYTKMDKPFRNADALISMLQGRRNVQICSGHLHAGMFTRRGDVTLMTCPPVSMLMELDLTPAGGNRFYTAQPGFALHTAEDGQVNSHLCCVPFCDHHSGPHNF